MKPEIQANKVVIFSGAGISAESGLSTFRDADGLWNQYPVDVVASLSGWQHCPEVLLEFYNDRRKQAAAAQPNAAHLAIAQLESAYEVVVITQNVDDLHERAGSSKIIHVHGELAYARSSTEPVLRYHIGAEAISMGQTCERGSQLRPDIVWFGEDIQFYQEARQHIASAARIMVVGTSLSVYPAASLLNAARYHADKVLIALQLDKRPYGFQCYGGRASNLVPAIVNRWLAEAGC